MCLIFSFTEKMHFYLTASLFALLTNNIIANHDDSPPLPPCNQVHFQQDIYTQEIGNIHFEARHNGHLSEQILYSI